MATSAFDPRAAAQRIASQFGQSQPEPSEAPSTFDPKAAAMRIAQSFGNSSPQQATPQASGTIAVPSEENLPVPAQTQSPSPQQTDSSITRLWNWLNSGPLQNQPFFKEGIDDAKALAARDAENGNWWRSYTTNFFAGSAEDASKLLTPLTAALSLVSEGAEPLAASGEAAAGIKALPTAVKVAKGLKNLALGYFGIQSAEAVWQKQQADESTPDYLQRVLFGASGLLGTTAAADDAVHNAMVKKLGLNEDLASRVQGHLENIKQVRDLSKFYDQYDWLRKAEHEANLEEAKVRLSRIPQDVDREAAQFQQDFRHAVGLEEMPIKQGFDDIADKMQSRPVSTPQELADMLERNVKELGANTAEVRPSVMKSFGNINKGDLGSAVEYLKNNGNTDAANALMQAAGAKTHSDFGDLNRFKDDLRNAAFVEKDPQMKKAYFKTASEVADLQEQAAEKAGLGDQYRDLKNRYFELQDKIGSGPGAKLLARGNLHERVVQDHLARLVGNSPAVKTVRALANHFGVSTEGIDSLQDEEAQLKQLLKGKVGPEKVPTDLRKAANDSLAQYLKEAKDDPKLVPGTNIDDLVERSSQELRKMRVDAIMTNLSKSGWKSPYRLMYGGLALGELARGSPFALYYGGRAIAPEVLDRLHNSEGYKHWLASEGSLFNPNQYPKLDSLVKFMRRHAAGVAGAAGTGAANHIKAEPDAFERLQAATGSSR